MQLTAGIAMVSAAESTELRKKFSVVVPESMYTGVALYGLMFPLALAVHVVPTPVPNGSTGNPNNVPT